MNKKRLTIHFLCLGMLTIFSASMASAQSSSEIHSLIERQSEILLTLVGDEAREAPLTTLLQDAERYKNAHPDSAEAWITSARIRFWYADTQSMRRGLAQLALVRDELLKAVSLDNTAQDGYAQAYLGYLYFIAPPWPLSFRNRKKSTAYFAEAEAINARAIGTNLLYTQILIYQEKYEQARPRIRLIQRLAEATNLSPNLKQLYVLNAQRYLQTVEEKNH